MCDFPAIPSPAQNHYSIVIFSDSVYPSYPAKYLKYVTRYCLAVNCVFVIISTNTEINGRLFSSKIHENSHLDFSTTNSPIFHITRPKITFSELEASLQFSCFESLHLHSNRCYTQIYIPWP